MMAATSICSSSGATTANGPRLQEARCSTVPDQLMHMEDPSLGNTQEMDGRGKPIEVLFHGRRGRSGRCQERGRKVIHDPEDRQRFPKSGSGENKEPLLTFVP